jgi:hypothetical protein
MSQFDTINDFNTYLSEKLRNVKLNEYFNLIHSQFYCNIDISFMDYFLELTNNENEFIVNHIKLQEYGVLTNIDSSAFIKKSLERLFLIENEDYQVCQVAQSRLENQHGGSNGNKKEYKLTPYAFKLCLIRSKNSKEYAKYYLLLEQVFKNYQEYQIMYQKVLLSGKDEKMDEMKAQINELLGYAKETKVQLDETKVQLDETKVQNEEMQDTMEEMKDNIDNLNDTMDDIKDAFKDTANRSVPSPRKENEQHEFILLQHKELLNNFKFIRGIQKLNETKINNKYSEYNIIKREYNANPIQLYKMFKDTLKDNYKLEKQKIINNKKLKNKTQLKKEIEKIKFTGNDLELQYDYTLNDLLDNLTKICNERFTEYNNYSDRP